MSNLNLHIIQNVITSLLKQEITETNAEQIIVEQTLPYHLSIQLLNTKPPKINKPTEISLSQVTEYINLYQMLVDQNIEKATPTSWIKSSKLMQKILQSNQNNPTQNPIYPLSTRTN